MASKEISTNTVESKQTLYNELNALIYKYKSKMDTQDLLNYIIRYTFVLLEQDNIIKTEYNEAYCDLFIDYAKNNMNPAGFWGKYRIDEGVKNEWMDKNHKFKQTMTLIPNITSDLMNQNISHIIASAGKLGDLKTSTQICLKLMDYQYRTDKDMGLFKDRGTENKDAKRRSSNEIDDEAVKMAEDFLGNEE